MSEQEQKNFVADKSASESGPHSKLAILIGFVQWLDTWKKVCILLVLLAVGGGGYLLYAHSELVVMWLSSVNGKSAINVKKLDGEAKSIARDSHADVIMIWDLDRKENLRRLRYFMVDGQRVEKLEGTSDIMLRARAEPSNILIDILNDSVGCFNLTTKSDVGNFLAKSGVSYYCAVTIPPDHSFMNGLLMLGFRNKPTNQDYIKQRLRIASDRLIR